MSSLSGGKKKDKAYHAESRKKALVQSMKSCHYPTTNRELSENKGFQTLCEKAGVKPTQRQASRFRNKTGSAFAAS